MTYAANWPKPTPRPSCPTWPRASTTWGFVFPTLDRREEALASSEEAVDIRRKLAEANPQAFLPDLASSLNNLGIRLSDLDRREEALASSEEAVDIRRKLAEANPQAFLPDLAMSLGVYGSILQAMELHEEAARAFKEGLQHMVPFYRDLPQSLHRPGEEAGSGLSPSLPEGWPGAGCRVAHSIR